MLRFVEMNVKVVLGLLFAAAVLAGGTWYWHEQRELFPLRAQVSSPEMHQKPIYDVRDESLGLSFEIPDGYTVSDIKDADDIRDGIQRRIVLTAPSGGDGEPSSISVLALITPMQESPLEWVTTHGLSKEYLSPFNFSDRVGYRYAPPHASPFSEIDTIYGENRGSIFVFTSFYAGPTDSQVQVFKQLLASVRFK